MRFPQVFFAGLLASLTFAQGQGIPSDDVSMLQKLRELRERRQQDFQKSVEAKINTIRSAVGSGSAAANLYTDAVGQVEFSGVDRQGPKFSEWKKNNAAMLRSREFQAAVQLHLQYIILTLQRAQTPDVGALLPQVSAYLTKLMETEELLARQEGRVPGEQRALLDKPLTDSVFTRAYGLGEELSKAGDWPMTPRNAGSLLDRVVRPIMREKKDPALLSTWDYQIRLEQVRAEATQRDIDKTKFEREVKPSLEWKKALDQAALGQQDAAKRQMFQLIMANPGHPEFDTWCDQLEKMLKGDGKSEE